MRPGPAALLLILLAAPVAAQVPATGWSAQLALDTPGALDLPRGNATAVEVTLRYTVAGGLCAAGQAPPGTATLALAAGGAEGITVTVEEARSVALACGETAETFLLTLAAAPGLAAGGHSLVLTADASPACTVPCGLTAQRAEAALTLTVPEPPQPPVRPPAGGGGNLTNLSTNEAPGGGDAAAAAGAGLPAGGLALLLAPAVAGLVAALLVALLVMNRIAR